jgi:hypothetical protein
LNARRTPSTFFFFPLFQAATAPLLCGCWELKSIGDRIFGISRKKQTNLARWEHCSTEERRISRLPGDAVHACVGYLSQTTSPHPIGGFLIKKTI